MTPLPDLPLFATPADTRREAHARARGKADQHRALILAAFRELAEATADQAGAHVGLGPLEARPRVSELRTMGQIEPTGKRAPSALGNSSVVWKVK